MAETKEVDEVVEEVKYDPKTGIVELHKKYPEHKLLWGEDFHPISKSGRTWGYWSYVGNWSVIFDAAPFAVAGAAVTLGLTVGLGLAVSAISILLLYILIVVQSHAAARYGLAEPQLTRMRWGVYGAWIASTIRGIIALGWFGIQTYVFTEITDGIYLILTGRVEELSKIAAAGPLAMYQLNPSLFIATFILIFILQGVLMYVSKVAVSQRTVKYVFYANIPIAIVSFTFLFLELMELTGWDWVGVWSISITPPDGLTTTIVALIFMNAVLADVITISMSMPDLVRFAKSQKVQILSQLTVIVFYIVINLYGLIGTAAAYKAFGKPIYDPILLSTIIPAPAWMQITLLLLLGYATYTVNVQANLIPPAYDLSNLYPGKLNFWKGALISLLIAALLQAWALYSNAIGFLVGWLGFYGGVLAPIVSVVFFDYLIIRRFKIDVRQLYLPNGEFRYWKGVNPAAVIATIVGSFVALFPYLPYHDIISAMSTYVGFFVAAPIYLLLMKYWVIPKYQKTLKGGLLEGYTNEIIEKIFSKKE